MRKCSTCGMTTESSQCPQCKTVTKCPTCKGSGRIVRMKQLV